MKSVSNRFLSNDMVYDIPGLIIPDDQTKASSQGKAIK